MAIVRKGPLFIVKCKSFAQRYADHEALALLEEGAAIIDELEEELADSIERGQAGVTDEVVARAINAFCVVPISNGDDANDEMMRAALLAVWPSVPAQPERGLNTDRRMKAVEHMLKNGWQWNGDAWVKSEPASADAEDAWREGWAAAYSGNDLYTDDGELQDNRIAPFIDWRGDSARDIKWKITMRAIDAARAAKGDE